MRSFVSLVFVLFFLAPTLYALPVAEGSSRLSKRAPLTERHELYDIRTIEKRGRGGNRPLPPLPSTDGPPPAAQRQQGPPAQGVPPRRLPIPPPQADVGPQPQPKQGPPPPIQPPRRLPIPPQAPNKLPGQQQPQSAQHHHGVMEGPSSVKMENYHNWKSGTGK